MRHRRAYVWQNPQNHTDPDGRVIDPNTEDVNALTQRIHAALFPRDRAARGNTTAIFITRTGHTLLATTAPYAHIDRHPELANDLAGIDEIVELDPLIEWTGVRHAGFTKREFVGAKFHAEDLIIYVHMLVRDATQEDRREGEMYSSRAACLGCAFLGHKFGVHKMSGETKVDSHRDEGGYLTYLLWTHAPSGVRRGREAPAAPEQGRRTRRRMR